MISISVVKLFRTVSIAISTASGFLESFCLGAIGEDALSKISKFLPWFVNSANSTKSLKLLCSWFVICEASSLRLSAHHGASSPLSNELLLKIQLNSIIQSSYWRLDEFQSIFSRLLCMAIKAYWGFSKSMLHCTSQTPSFVFAAVENFSCLTPAVVLSVLVSYTRTRWIMYTL